MISIPATTIVDLEGRNATNNIFRIKIDPDTPYPAAVWTQERYESRYKLGSLIHPLRLFRRLFKTEEFKRELELMGHEIEVQAAVVFYGALEIDYRLREAQGMKRHGSYHFETWSTSDIFGAMQRWKPEAIRWVRDHQDLIRDMKKKLG